MKTLIFIYTCSIFFLCFSKFASFPVLEGENYYNKRKAPNQISFKLKTDKLNDENYLNKVSSFFFEQNTYILNIPNDSMRYSDVSGIENSINVPYPHLYEIYIDSVNFTKAYMFFKSSGIPVVNIFSDNYNNAGLVQIRFPDIKSKIHLYRQSFLFEGI